MFTESNICLIIGIISFPDHFRQTLALNFLLPTLFLILSFQVRRISNCKSNYFINQLQFSSQPSQIGFEMAMNYFIKYNKKSQQKVWTISLLNIILKNLPEKICKNYEQIFAVSYFL